MSATLSPSFPDSAPDRTPAGAAIRFETVEKVWPRRDGGSFAALKGVTLDVPAGAITGIIGRSGAGKSTLLRVVNGLERPSAGRVVVDGRDVTRMGPTELRDMRRRIGMIFQHFNLLANRTVRQNVALPLEIAGMARGAIAARVDPLIERVGLTELAGRYPAQLSGGQKQRVGIARALATNPGVLLSDEATSALDPETTRSVLALLRDINRELGLTVLLITHEMDVVRQICDRVAVIEAGRIVEEGDTFDVFVRPQDTATRAMLHGVTGVELPAFVRDRMTAGPSAAGGQGVLSITFAGPHATDPVLAGLAADRGIAANIFAGSVDEIAGRPFGRLVVGIDAPRMAEAQAYLAERGLMSEVLGHVA